MIWRIRILLLYHFSMNILVTGGAGFIGSHFVLRHVAGFPSDSIVVLDSLTYAADRSFLDPVNRSIEFIEGDITDVSQLHSIVQGSKIDAIVNFAAETHVDRSIENAIPFIHSNILGVQSLIEVCRRNPELLLVHVSTDEVYGDLKDGDDAFSLSSTLHPSSPYAATKAAGDLLLLAAVRTYGIRVRITRCTNNYGPHQDRSKLLPVIINRGLAGQPIPIYGKGEQKRDWLYVTDHTDAIESVLADGKDGQIYLIGADSEQRNVDVARTVLQLLGKPESLIQFVADRPGHDWRYALDSSSARQLGWEPKVTFPEGVRQTIAWYKSRLEEE
jgi:dTDP-glucose 4,6-dehydratase